MSRIGLSPVEIPKEVTVEVSEKSVSIKGPKGTLSTQIPQVIELSISEGKATFQRNRNDKNVQSVHGTTRSLFANAVKGVSKGWQKELEMVGVGYRAKLIGPKLEISVGYSHPVMVDPPQGITFEVQKDKIIVSGIDKYLVGQVAANIRAIRKPEPYKGKGIKYVGEVIRRKAGKSAKAVGGASGGK